MAEKIAKNPLVLITLAFISGIILGKNFLCYPDSLVITFCLYLIFLFTVLLLKNVKTAFILLLISLVFSAALRYDLATEIKPRNLLSRFVPSSLESITGIIEEAHYRQNNYNTYIVKTFTMKSEALTTELNAIR